MEPDLFLKGNSRLAVHGIPRRVWNLKCRPPLVPVLSQINPVHILMPSLFQGSF